MILQDKYEVQYTYSIFYNCITKSLYLRFKMFILERISISKLS